METPIQDYDRYNNSNSNDKYNNINNTKQMERKYQNYL